MLECGGGEERSGEVRVVGGGGRGVASVLRCGAR